MRLKSHSRIEAFLFLYFLALLTEALIEREIRRRMKELKISQLPIYPEGRPCAAPTPIVSFISSRIYDGTASWVPISACISASTTRSMSRSEPCCVYLGLSPTRYLSTAEEPRPPPTS